MEQDVEDLCKSEQNTTQYNSRVIENHKKNPIKNEQTEKILLSASEYRPRLHSPPPSPQHDLRRRIYLERDSLEDELNEGAARMAQRVEEARSSPDVEYHTPPLEPHPLHLLPGSSFYLRPPPLPDPLASRPKKVPVVTKYRCSPVFLQPLGVRASRKSAPYGLDKSSEVEKAGFQCVVPLPETNKKCPKKRKFEEITGEKEEEEEETENNEGRVIFEEEEPELLYEHSTSSSSSKVHKLRKLVQGAYLRVPLRNKIPNMFIPKKTDDRRGKATKKSKQEKQKAFFLRHGVTNNTNYSEEYGVDSTCHNCGGDGDRCFIYDRRQGDTVCKNCSVVQKNIKIFENHSKKTEASLEREKAPQFSSSRRAYISEKLRQFSNTEPRINDQDLSIIRNTYYNLRKDFNSDHPRRPSVLNGPAKETSSRVKSIREWFTPKEEDLTKARVRGLLKFIDKELGHLKKPGSISFVKKYLERWTQLKAYFCGDRYYYDAIASRPNAQLLQFMLQMALLVSEVYDNKELREAALNYTGPVVNLHESSTDSSDGSGDVRCCGWLKEMLERKNNNNQEGEVEVKLERESKNIPSINILFLILLFMYDETTLECHGWYYVSKNMHQLTFPQLNRRKVKVNSKAQSQKFDTIVQNFHAHRKFLIYINNNFQVLLTEIFDNAGLDLSSGIKLPSSLEELVQISARNSAAYQFQIPEQ